MAAETLTRRLRGCRVVSWTLRLSPRRLSGRATPSSASDRSSPRGQGPRGSCRFGLGRSVPLLVASQRPTPRSSSHRPGLASRSCWSS
uniref:Uncharacterized protein n=1 Tax=uncultured marine virus TaxID=186617 RepID=A0A0F7L9E3_9VIRU|nr:hypothetical protein [uncultured marine virus]